MSEYDSAIATASRLIKKKGAPITLTFTESRAYDPATGQSARADYSYSGTGVKLDYELKEIDGTNILRGDQKVLIAVDIPVTPMPGNKMLIGTKTWTVISSQPLDPGGINVMHTVQVRA